MQKNRFINWFSKYTVAICACVLMAALGIGSMVWSLNTTIIGEDVSIGGNLTVGGKNVCLEDGTNCPAAGIPSGTIAMFDTSCPLGWTRFTSLDGRVPRGSETFGGTGGEDEHAHEASKVEIPYTLVARYPGQADRAGDYGNFSLDIESSSSWPPYIDVVWCKKN